VFTGNERGKQYNEKQSTVILVFCKCNFKTKGHMSMMGSLIKHRDIFTLLCFLEFIWEGRFLLH